MNTTLIDSETPLPNDDEIAALIKMKTNPDADGNAMEVAILAASGRPYRLITSHDFTEYLGLVSGLEELGFVNTGKPLRAHGISFDDVFSSGR